MAIVLYANPSTSLMVFLAWMHCVYSNSLHYVPVYFVAGIISILLDNYQTFAMNRNRNAGFTPITISEMTKALFLGGPNSHFIQPISIMPQAEIEKSLRSKSDDELDQEELTDKVLSGAGIRLDGDHVEFPFSERGRYPKKTLAEGCVDASAMFEEEDDDDEKSSGRFACKFIITNTLEQNHQVNKSADILSQFFYPTTALKKMAQKNANMKSLLMMNRDDGEEDDEAELGLDDHPVRDIADKAVEITGKTVDVTVDTTDKVAEIVTEKVAELGVRPPQARGANGSASLSPPSLIKRKVSTDNKASAVESTTQSSVPPEELWKRVKDPRGLPEQDASVYVKSRKTLKEEIVHNKNLLHKYSQRLFDDRMFIVNEEDPGHKAGEELVLNNAIGTNKHKNPMVAKMAEVSNLSTCARMSIFSIPSSRYSSFTYSFNFKYIAPGLEGIKVGLSVWRAGFNLFAWSDPFLTFLFLCGCIFLFFLLIIFPWRIFFFLMGCGALGPQVRACRTYSFQF